MAKITTNFRCAECGWTCIKWVGRCAECQTWGSVIDAAERTGIVRSVKPAAIDSDRVAKPITEITATDVAHWPTGINEFDRVLGGGIVPGATILLMGYPFHCRKRPKAVLLSYPSWCWRLLTPAVVGLSSSGQ